MTTHTTAHDHGIAIRYVAPVRQHLFTGSYSFYKILLTTYIYCTWFYVWIESETCPIVNNIAEWDYHCFYWAFERIFFIESGGRVSRDLHCMLPQPYLQSGRSHGETRDLLHVNKQRRSADCSESRPTVQYNRQQLLALQKRHVLQSPASCSTHYKGCNYCAVAVAIEEVLVDGRTYVASPSSSGSGPSVDKGTERRDQVFWWGQPSSATVMSSVTSEIMEEVKKETQLQLSRRHCMC